MVNNWLFRLLDWEYWTAIHFVFCAIGLVAIIVILLRGGDKTIVSNIFRSMFALIGIVMLSGMVDSASLLLGSLGFFPLPVNVLLISLVGICFAMAATLNVKLKRKD